MDAYKKILILLGIIIIVILFAIIIFTYVFRVDSPAVSSVRSLFRLPAITVDGKWISIAELEENTASIKRFYEEQDFSQYGIRIDFDTDNGKKRLQLQERKMINKLIEDIVIAQLAKEWGITISEEAVKDAMNRPMNEMDSKQEVESRLERLYGWSLDDFGKKVVKKQLLRDKVAAQFNQKNSITDELNAKIHLAKKELDDGRDFADVAKKYSEGSSASAGGIMGWFAQGQLQDEIGKEIFTMDSGQYTDVIETPLGLHIVNVDEVSEVDGQKIIHISQIVVKRKTLANFLDEEIRKRDVKVFLPQYKWNPETAMVEFVDVSMDEFEQNIQKEAEEFKKEALETQK
jgi:parvulin-like peptidyl-prolyl isomerase